MEFCKTRTEKSSPDMFNLYVVFAGHNMVSDAARATTCRCKMEPHHSKQKVQKTKCIPKTWVLMGGKFEDFRRKRNRTIILDISKDPNGTTGS